MAGVNDGLTRLKTIPIAEQAVPESLLDMLARSLWGSAHAAAPGAGVQFPQGEGEAFNPASAYNPAGQRFVRDLPYESYSGMSKGGLPEYEDAGIEMDKKGVTRPLSDFSVRSFGGGVPGGKFHGHVAEAIGPSGQRIVAKAERFSKGGKVGEVEDIKGLSAMSPSADNSTDWVKRHYTAREKLIDALKSLPAGMAEGTANLVAIPRSMNDVVARTAERPTGLEGVLPTEDENLE